MEGAKCHPNRVTMSVLVEGLFSEGYIHKAFKLVSNVVAGGGHVSSSECHSCLAISLLRVKSVEEAYKLFRCMLDSSVRPDGLACSILNFDEGYVLKRKINDAFTLYADLEKKGFVVTIDSYIISYLLFGLCQQNCVVEVAKLVSLMVEKGIYVNASYIGDIHKHLKGSVHVDSLAKLFRMRKTQKSELLSFLC